MLFKLRLRHVNAAIAVVMAALTAWAIGTEIAEHGDFKPSAQPDAKSPCIDGQPPVNWVCSDGARI